MGRLRKRIRFFLLNYFINVVKNDSIYMIFDFVVLVKEKLIRGSIIFLR